MRSAQARFNLKTKTPVTQKFANDETYLRSQTRSLKSEIIQKKGNFSMAGKFSSFFANNFSSRRWQKRLLKPFLPEVASIDVLEGEAEIFYSPRAMKGPSFDISNQKEKGFLSYEEQSKNALLSKIPQNGVLYDVGANIGLFSTFIGIKRPDINIHSFEPEPRAFKCLHQSASTLKNKNVHVHNFALGRENKSMELHRSSINDGGHTLVPVRSSFSEKTAQPNLLNLRTYKT